MNHHQNSFFFSSLLSSFLPSCLFLLPPSNSKSFLWIQFILQHWLEQSHDIFLNTNANLLIKRLPPFLCIYNISSLFCMLLHAHQWFNITKYHPFYDMMMVHLNRNIILLTFFLITLFFNFFSIMHTTHVIECKYTSWSKISVAYAGADSRRHWSLHELKVHVL